MQLPTENERFLEVEKARGYEETANRFGFLPEMDVNMGVFFLCESCVKSPNARGFLRNCQANSFETTGVFVDEFAPVWVQKQFLKINFLTPIQGFDIVTDITLRIPTFSPQGDP